MWCLEVCRVIWFLLSGGTVLFIHLDQKTCWMSCYTWIKNAFVSCSILKLCKLIVSVWTLFNLILLNLIIEIIE